RLAPLLTIARNLWWSWHPGAVELFERVDPEVWQATHHNPVQLLGRVSRRQLEALAEDDSFTSHMETVAQRLDEYLHAPSWFTKHHSGEEGLIAYFSAEYGFHECLPIYSGGLGILSGEHLKSASDLGLPMVGVGLAYRHGYFR
ncbi:MAG TPA: alpha-glucan phosphorylase, partial [Proteobacteria bacterium]|nr:alpha-glucan phosphorylase [Pseudomonadota bacterium]